MKKLVLAVSLLACLLLTACGNAAQQRFLAFSEELAQRDALSFTADLTASYPDRDAAFTLRYELSDGTQRITVLAPGSISGVSARIDADGTKLEYDGAVLDTGDLDGFGLSPMSALPAVVTALTQGHADAFWTEDGMDAVELQLDDSTTVRVHFGRDGVPCRAELISDGTVTVVCQIKNWS
ncbi:MAG: hypothetical protein IK095_08370 [Oscillospiraceae bacterium]|nr:hypothetical protein [Oscillospiraceae bacterium]